jgi:hypothetical protein
MLKITTQTDPERTILELEGKLTGPWVQELEACWRACIDRRISVLLCAVTFIDDKGKDLLAEMYQHGTELVAEGCMNKAIVEEITREGQGGRRKYGA